jgi:hypothetical protein
MHWLLDVEFKDDLSRYRTGHGAKNMAIVRRFALGLVRAEKSNGSVKTRRKIASWNPDFPPNPSAKMSVNLDSGPWKHVIGRLGGPASLESSARETKAFLRARAIENAVHLLRIILAYCLGERGLRSTARIF